MTLLRSSVSAYDGVAGQRDASMDAELQRLVEEVMHTVAARCTFLKSSEYKWSPASGGEPWATTGVGQGSEGVVRALSAAAWIDLATRQHMHKPVAACMLLGTGLLLGTGQEPHARS